MPTLKETEALVARLFEGVTDKAGQPYVEHCRRVARGVSTYAEDVIHAAWLHDVVEDTATTISDLLAMGYSNRTIWLVAMLTREAGLPYGRYVRAIADTGDADLIAIKLSDLSENSNPERLALLPEETRARLAAKYAQARIILSGR